MQNLGSGTTVARVVGDINRWPWAIAPARSNCRVRPGQNTDSNEALLSNSASPSRVRLLGCLGVHKRPAKSFFLQWDDVSNTTEKETVRAIVRDGSMGVHAGEGGLCGTIVIGRATRLARAALVGLLQDWLGERWRLQSGEDVCWRVVLFGWCSGSLLASCFT